MRFKDCYRYIEEKDISSEFDNLKYVSTDTEEPLKELLLYEVEYMLDRIVFSKKNNSIIKLIVVLHCLGYTDLEIATGFNKIRIKQVSKEAVTKTRQRAFKKIKETFNKDIGLITLLYEAFREVKDD